MQYFGKILGTMKRFIEMASASDPQLLTIGDLAGRTGVPSATLRSWETRYGFPRPTRLAGKHRRYADSDVTAVLEVLHHRGSGLSLEAAVRRATTTSLQSRSVFAELRRGHPELTSQLLSKATLLAISHAMEDECCARAESPVLFGGFQRDKFLNASYARWVELARTARTAVVFAALADPRPARPGLPIEVALPRDAPLNREWLVVCDAPDLPACLAAVERPGHEGAPDSQPRFEAVWTVDPQVVRHASRVAAALADAYRPGWGTGDLATADSEPSSASPDLRRASDLLNRMVGYLDARR
jgi:DICT domain-containing protein/predicted DNA-binding transcriptional regulator AlpA